MSNKANNNNKRTPKRGVSGRALQPIQNPDPLDQAVEIQGQRYALSQFYPRLVQGARVPDMGAGPTETVSIEIDGGMVGVNDGGVEYSLAALNCMSNTLGPAIMSCGNTITEGKWADFSTYTVPEAAAIAARYSLVRVVSCELEAMWAGKAEDMRGNYYIGQIDSDLTKLQEPTTIIGWGGVHQILTKISDGARSIRVLSNPGDTMWYDPNSATDARTELGYIWTVPIIGYMGSYISGNVAAFKVKATINFECVPFHTVGRLSFADDVPNSTESFEKAYNAGKELVGSVDFISNPKRSESGLKKFARVLWGFSRDVVLPTVASAVLTRALGPGGATAATVGLNAIPGPQRDYVRRVIPMSPTSNLLSSALGRGGMAGSYHYVVTLRMLGYWTKEEIDSLPPRARDCMRYLAKCTVKRQDKTMWLEEEGEWEELPKAPAKFLERR